MTERDLLRELLYGVRSHLHVIHALEGLDPQLAGVRVEGSPHTLQQVLLHMSYWQDITLARMRGENPPMPPTAAEGWDFPARPLDESDWEAAIASFAEGLRSIETLVADPDYDLDRIVRRDREMTAREQVLMVQGHNSYHLGQIVQQRLQLGAWPPPKGGDTW
jgi:uncharacterized damage-inducible protein DinB